MNDLRRQGWSKGAVALALIGFGLQGVSGAASLARFDGADHRPSQTLSARSSTVIRSIELHPRVVPQRGGRVTLTVHVAGARNCTFSDSNFAFVFRGELPRTVPCSTGSATVTLKIPSISTFYCGILTQGYPIDNCNWTIKVTATGSSSVSWYPWFLQQGEHCKGMCFFNLGTSGMMSWPASYDVVALQNWPVNIFQGANSFGAVPGPGINGQYYASSQGGGVKDATGCFTILVVSVAPAAAWLPWTCTSGVTPPASVPPLPSGYT